MGARIILGTRGTEVGLWVSKPTKLATSTAYDDLLVDTTRINSQPIFKGQVVNPTINQNSTYSLAVSTPGVGIANPGYAGYYQLVMSHNLGYIPLCHISIGSSNAGDVYPQVFLTTNDLYLLFQQRMSGEWVYYISSWNYQQDSAPSSYTFNCSIGYTIFRQQAV